MSTRNRGRSPALLIGLAIVLAAPIAAAAQAAGPSGAVRLELLENTPDRIVLRCDLEAYKEEIVQVDGAPYMRIHLDGEAPLMVAGEPSLPTVSRSLIIPDVARMEVRVLDSEFTELERDVLPSKGSILRTVDPATVPYRFGPVYQTDAYYPGPLARLREPYIMRDHRGVTLVLQPFQYDPVTRSLRVYSRITVEVFSAGAGEVNVMERGEPRPLSRAFHRIYEHHFLNYAPAADYEPLDEQGELLIICHDEWLPDIAPLVEHKLSLGLQTTVVGVSTLPSNTAAAIKNYIRGRYLLGNLAFVLLVGDSGEVATPLEGSDACDPSYALLMGTDDYPEILVGRFSAQTAAQVDTQVQRTIAYESAPATAQDWFWRGTGIASDQGPGDDDEYDFEHMENIRGDLLPAGYDPVDAIYDPWATAGQVTAALDDGRGIVNYCGHGSPTSWSTTGFSNSDVNALTNDGMLPFIFSVACVNGQFNGMTCFAEAWLRATHGTQPTGAIGAYMSSIDQYWDEPMAAQDEFVDLLVSDQQPYACLGAFCFAGSCLMMDEYGETGADMFRTWHLFGDPTLCIVTGTAPSCPQDLDGSGDVGFSDLLQLLGVWGPCAGCPEDLDGSGDVGFGDLLEVLGAWGSCG